MARKLKSFHFRHTGGSVSHYDWDTWFDGSIWALEQGVDFEVTPKAFRSVATTAAKRAGLKIHSSNLKDDPVVVIQAYKPE